jgi:hypothetical protein
MDVRRLREGAAAGFESERRSAGTVRPLEQRDIARVAQLHARTFGAAGAVPPPSLEQRLSRLLLGHPWSDESLPSLVFEDGGGTVVGCLGVMPRPMSFNGRRITAAVSHSFIVEPHVRSTLAALELAKRFIAGPQDLSLAEGSNVSRRIWEQLGGAASLVYGLCWTRPLRPGRYVLSYLGKRGLAPAWERVLRPVCSLADAAAPLISRKAFGLPQPAGSASDLDAGTLQRSIAEFTNKRSLRPQYDERSLGWLLETLAQEKERGALQQVAVRHGGRGALGWYLYYCKAGGIGAVVQLGAKEGCAELVIEHLFHHAKQRGVVALSGQVDPALFHLYSRKDCLFHHDGASWLLLHSRHPEILQAVDRGDAFLTRLEGEWWISVVLNANAHRSGFGR